MNKIGEQCEHGQLKRQCQICELIENRDFFRGRLQEAWQEITRLDEVRLQLETRLDKLQGYARHKDGCALIGAYERGCTCGLDELL